MEIDCKKVLQPFHNELYPHLWTMSDIARYQECLKSLVYLLQSEHHNFHSTSKVRTFWGSGDILVHPHVFKGLNFEARVVVGVRRLVGMARIRIWVMKVLTKT